MTSSRPVPLLDLHRGNQPLREQVLQAIAEVFDSGQYLHGRPCRDLESEIAKISGVRHGVSCGSGSDALLLSLMALDIGPGDEVIAPSFTFFATVSAIWRLGASPVLVDIEPDSFNLDPSAVAAAITPKTKAIIPVHLFGQSAQMDEIQKIADQAGVPVIEDAAQAIGAKFGDQPVGSMGLASCYSFYPTKNLGGFGNGGMLVTDDEQHAEKLRLLADHGMQARYHHQMVGVNSRLDTIQAAALLVKLKCLPGYTEARRRNAACYESLFVDAGLQSCIALPKELEGRFHIWNQYTIRAPRGVRDELRASLAEQGIGTQIYYPVPVHLQECFRSLGYEKGSLPETERACDEVLNLPIFPELTEEEQARVVGGIEGFFAQRRVSAA